MMRPRLAFLLLPYTRAELPGWGRLLTWARVRGGNSSANWRGQYRVVIRGKRHGYLMKLDLSDWAQRLTYFLGRYYELGVQRVLDVLLRPGDRFADIGANIGMITLHARFVVGAEGRVDCFEPNPECVEVIQEHLRINALENVFVHQYALADAPGALVLNLTSEHSGTATLAEVGSEAVRTMTVDVRVGDDELQEAPRVIKIDVEGFELRVLKGLTRTLLAHKPFLLTELIDGQLARAGSSVTEVTSLLFDMGYAAFGVHSARKFLSHELLLLPVERGGDFIAFSDVLWAHPDQRRDFGAYLPA